VTDVGEVSENDDYRVVVSRDGPWWVARTYGRYLPENGVEARSGTLAGLKDEANRCSTRRATWRGGRLAGRPAAAPRAGPTNTTSGRALTASLQPSGKPGRRCGRRKWTGRNAATSSLPTWLRCTTRRWPKLPTSLKCAAPMRRRNCSTTEVPAGCLSPMPAQGGARGPRTDRGQSRMVGSAPGGYRLGQAAGGQRKPAVQPDLGAGIAIMGPRPPRGPQRKLDALLGTAC
jgi:hypothetical protein